MDIFRKRLKQFILKVEQYNSGEGYEGYWFSVGYNLDDAINQLKERNDIKRLESWGGLVIAKSSLDEMVKHFNKDQCIREIIGDNYN